MLLLLFEGVLLLRFATRTLFQLLFQPPPRNTLFLACPQAVRSQRSIAVRARRDAHYEPAFSLARLRFQPPMSRPISSIKRAACSSCPRLMHLRS